MLYTDMFQGHGVSIEDVDLKRRVHCNQIVIIHVEIFTKLCIFWNGVDGRLVAQRSPIGLLSLEVKC